MFEHLDTKQDVFARNLGAALTMERNIVEMLDDLIEAAREPAIKDALREHQQQTRGHVQNVEQAFKLVGWEVDDSPCPAIEAIEKEGKGNLKRADDSLADPLILAGAAETEHHEMAVYETLITEAEGFGQEDVAQLLSRNLEDERQALRKVSSLSRELAGAAQLRV